MEIYISYFYKIRFFKPNMIPLSTAVSDPKWFHGNRSIYHNFLDKNRVLNGLRIEELVPNSSCNSLCRGREKCSYEPANCEFLRRYYEQLCQLDFDVLMKKLEGIAANYCKTFNIVEEPQIIFIVYETPDNPCSERHVIQRYFKEHGTLVWNR